MCKALSSLFQTTCMKISYSKNGKVGLVKHHSELYMVIEFKIPDLNLYLKMVISTRPFLDRILILLGSTTIGKSITVLYSLNVILSKRVPQPE